MDERANPSLGLTLRPAMPADVAALMAIHEACCAEITARLGRGHWSLAPTCEGLLASLERRMTFVVLLGREPAATVTTSDEPASFWPPHVWAEPYAAAQCVFALAVRPDLQRRGIGSWAMRRMEVIAAEHARRWMRLDAYAANPRALRFYRKLGYRARGEVTVNGTRMVCFEKEVR